jgi:AraC-like DNA-binding protein
MRPGAASVLLGANPRELENRVVSVEELWSERLITQNQALAAGGDVATVIAALEKMLLSRVDGCTSSVVYRTKLLARVLDQFRADRDVTLASIPLLAKSVGVSERQLRRLFHAEIGMSPKRYLRIARIRNVLARAGTTGWGRLAAEHGFFDQSHLGAEFRALVGVTPRSFVNQGLHGANVCGSTLRAHPTRRA